MGKPRLNTETKKAKGTLRPCRERAKTAEFAALMQIPAAPAALGKGGRALWQNLGGRLAVAGILTDADLPAFQLLCESRDRADDLKNKLTNGGKTLFSDAIARPENAALYRAFKFETDFSKKLFAEFGATPRSRNSVNITPQENQSPDEKRMKELLSGLM